jgi:hypothetical protein
MILGMSGYAPGSTGTAAVHRNQALCSMVWNVAHGKARKHGTAVSAAWVLAIQASLPAGINLYADCMHPDAGTGIVP